jgi:hypothetical protein
VFLHVMLFAIPTCAAVTVVWAALCRLVWRRKKSLEEL